MEQLTLDVLNERIISLRNEENIIHDQLASQIQRVSDMMLEERRRLNGSLEEIRDELKSMRALFESKMEQLDNKIGGRVNQLEAEINAIKLDTAKNAPVSWKNSFIITFLSTLCGILLTLVISRGL